MLFPPFHTLLLPLHYDATVMSLISTHIYSPSFLPSLTGIVGISSFLLGFSFPNQSPHTTPQTLPFLLRIMLCLFLLYVFTIFHFPFKDLYVFRFSVQYYLSLLFCSIMSFFIELFKQSFSRCRCCLFFFLFMRAILLLIIITAETLLVEPFFTLRHNTA